MRYITAEIAIMRKNIKKYRYREIVEMGNLFDSILMGVGQTTIAVSDFILCIAVALTAGVMYAVAYSIKNRSGRSFRTALILLPAVVTVVIMMVNGNIGIGVATAGAFSLVRFRSAQGSAKEISLIFMSMCSGLIAGVGYFAYSILFTAIMCVGVIICNFIFAVGRRRDLTRMLKMTVPEDLDYTGAFDDIFSDFTTVCEPCSVKTSNMGSLFKLSYRVVLKKGKSEKDFIDSLRVRNGNLEISLLKTEDNDEL